MGHFPKYSLPIKKTKCWLHNWTFHAEITHHWVEFIQPKCKGSVEICCKWYLIISNNICFSIFKTPCHNNRKECLMEFMEHSSKKYNRAIFEMYVMSCNALKRREPFHLHITKYYPNTLIKWSLEVSRWKPSNMKASISPCHFKMDCLSILHLFTHKSRYTQQFIFWVDSHKRPKHRKAQRQ